jgi:hypothetical protein
LRNINLRYSLALKNADLERATYNIYHGQTENFGQSLFAERMRLVFPNTCRAFTTEELIGNDGVGRSINKAIFPDFLNYLERTESQKQYQSRANSGKAWSTTTGRVVDASTCN